MAPFVPEEVDVFKIPHSRMKELVDDYFNMLQTTNFTSTVDLELLLENLDRTFCEFRIHEMIENKFIMKKLKSKLKKLSIQNSAVCNCHKDSRLASILLMVREGFNKKTAQDRVNFGLKLTKELQDFTETFLPHMEEEEEVFMPMLQKYFTYEELRDLRDRVIQQHLAQKEVQQHLQSFLGAASKEQCTSSSESDEDDYELEKAKRLSLEAEALQRLRVTDLPPEVNSRVFSFLSPRDLGRCAQVCRDWSRSTSDPRLWRVLKPVQWAQGDWSTTAHRKDDNEEDEEEDEDTDEDDEEGSRYAGVDEDADIDETEDPELYCDSLQQAWKEARILSGLAKYVLPKVGHGVQQLILTNSRSLTNGLLKKMLVSCPNLEVLDLGQTRISDDGLKCIGKNGCCSQLKQLSLSGCVNVSDSTLVRLAMAVSHTPQDPCFLYDNDSPCAWEGNEVQFSTCEATTSACLCEEYYETCGKKLNTSCEGESFEEFAENQNGEAADDFETKKLADDSQKYEGGYDEDKDIDEVAMVNDAEGATMATQQAATNVAMELEGSRNGERTLKPKDPCHSCCGKFVDLEFTAIEDCYKLRGKNVAPSSGEREKCKGRCKTQPMKETSPALQYLNLSGCFQVTDLGLRALARCAQFPQLQHLDLSGCLKVTGPALTELVKSCPNLQHQQLFYCDNITDGPFADTASGCRNLECRNRVCCRSGR